MASDTRCELDDRGKRICVWFPYSPNAIALVREVPGRKYVPPDKGGPYWSFPLELRIARQLRTIFPGMKLGPRVTEWGRTEANQERNLHSLSHADDAELGKLLKSNKDLHDFISTRPYQRADVAFMSGQSVVNANEPSLGKTVETIAAIWEKGLEGGPQLIIAPGRLVMDSVWLPEIEFHDGAEVLMYQGPNRRNELPRMNELIEAGQPFYLLTNFDTLRSDIGELNIIDWNTITVDEFHKSGLPNTKSKFFKAAHTLRARRRWVLSGTPIGGKPERLFGALQFMHPDRFTSKWRWVYQWLTVEDNGFGKKIGGIKPGKEAEFYESLRPYLIRRTKAEVRKDLPEKQYIDVWCNMVPKQAAQYKQMAEETEIRIDEEHLTAANVLALYTRLKQFANSRQRIIEGVLTPTFDSGKLPHLLGHLEDRGIAKESEGDTQVIIGTQFKAWAYLIQLYLAEQGIESTGVISGDTKNKDRLLMAGPDGLFQSGKLRVLILVTQAGGVALNLDAAESVHVMDETWNPDDQTQLEDRGHRFTGLTVYNYRSKGTIEEYIQEVGWKKTAINTSILDLRRRNIVHA